MGDRSSCADVIAETLRAAGVRYVFGHPGGEIVDFISALDGAGIEFLLTGHESAAAFMAGAVGRITGIPGVCLATLGPGACNLVLGVGSAFLDRDPLLAFSGRTTEKKSAFTPKQSLPLNAIFSPITKMSVALTGKGTASSVNSAISLAAKPPRGPVYLSLSADVAVGPDYPVETASAPPELSPENDQSLESIVEALNAAKRPMAIVGIGTDCKCTRNAVRTFFAETRIPYVTSAQAKGLADESRDTFVGTFGLGAGDAPILGALNRSDCLLAIGFDPVEFSSNWYRGRRIYSLAAYPTAFGQYEPAGECVGAVGALLDQLRSASRGTSNWNVSEIQKLRTGIDSAICPPTEASSAGLSPYHLFHSLRQALPEETIVTADVGAHKMVLAQTWRAPEPGSFLISNCLSAMGYGVPAALAAALLRPDAPVVGIIGDGGFGMMVQELETAKRIGVKPLFVVLCDRSLAVIKIAQDARRLPHLGVDFAPVDWVKVGEGFGARAFATSSLAEVVKHIGHWLAHRELTVLAVPIDETLYAGLSY